NPCYQLDALQPGLLDACLERRADELIRKAGVMAIVIAGGELRAGDAVSVELPEGARTPLRPV
ncbi:MAG TPA: hypothetical protein VGC92_04320, partial [Phenylobacterium sp.]